MEDLEGANALAKQVLTDVQDRQGSSVKRNRKRKD